MSDPEKNVEPEPQIENAGDALESKPEAHDVASLHGAILRERIDPREGYEPVPMWFNMLCGALLMWGGWYIAEFSGGGQANVLDPRPIARFENRGGEKKELDPFELGGKLYTAQCVSCHQQSGLGVPGQYPPLVDSQWVLETPPARLKRVLLNGLKGEIVVKGETYNGNMPAFARLKDDQIAAILTYIRGSWGNAGSPVSAESVAATRAATANKRGEWTAAELEPITKDDYTPPPPGEEKKPPEEKEEE
ncbi:MAG: cytochrome c [Planctomycetota bacterium]